MMFSFISFYLGVKTDSIMVDTLFYAWDMKSTTFLGFIYYNLRLKLLVVNYALLYLDPADIDYSIIILLIKKKVNITFLSNHFTFILKKCAVQGILYPHHLC